MWNYSNRSCHTKSSYTEANENGETNKTQCARWFRKKWARAKFALNWMKNLANWSLTCFCTLDFRWCRRSSRQWCEARRALLRTERRLPKSSPCQRWPFRIRCRLCAPNLGFRLCHSVWNEKEKRFKTWNYLVYLQFCGKFPSIKQFV